MKVRLRRLKADFEKLCTFFTQKSRIRIKKTLGDPPEKYQIEYLVTGMEKRASDGRIHIRSNFLVEITLTGSYPRMAPQCRMLTPVFHPNIAPHAICIGDHWAAGESLGNLVVRIAEMLSYQSYNLKSPLNGEASKWTEENEGRLPLDGFDFSSLLSVGEAVGRKADGSLVAGDVCANCGRHERRPQKPPPHGPIAGVGPSKGEMIVCIDGHVACADCVLTCPVCGGTACLKCALGTCTVCRRTICQKCSYKCGSCGRLVCSDHRGACHVCRLGKCPDCLVTCDLCGRPTCIDHIQKGRTPDGATKYVCTSCRSDLSRSPGAAS